MYDVNTPIGMSVKDPMENTATPDTIIPDEHVNFDVLITTGGPVWDKECKYLLILTQGKFQKIQTFRVN